MAEEVEKIGYSTRDGVEKDISAFGKRLYIWGKQKREVEDDTEFSNLSD